MTKSVTVNFDDGSSHTYDNVPDDVTDDQVATRASGEFSDKTISEISSGGSAAMAAPAAGPVAPEVSLPEKIAGAAATAGQLAMEHPAIPAAAAGLWKANKVANAYIGAKEAEAAAANQRAAIQAQTAQGHQNIQQQKINLKAGLPPAGQSGPQILNAQGQPIGAVNPAETSMGAQTTTKTTMTSGAPAAESSLMTKASDVVRKLALDKVLKSAGIAAGAYELGKGLFYTSPEEIAALKQAEARKRAQGWKPLNER